MTTTSSQCDELRDWACELRKLANGPVNEGFPARAKLFESADAMCQAADTILELRDDLQRANDAVQDAEHDESMAWDRVRKAEAENANLKKLVRDVYALNWNGFDCTECPWFDECRTEGGCPWLGILHDHMRELGVKAR